MWPCSHIKNIWVRISYPYYKVIHSEHFRYWVRYSDWLYFEYEFKIIIKSYRTVYSVHTPLWSLNFRAQFSYSYFKVVASEHYLLATALWLTVCRVYVQNWYSNTSWPHGYMCDVTLIKHCDVCFVLIGYLI